MSGLGALRMDLCFTALVQMPCPCRLHVMQVCKDKADFASVSLSIVMGNRGAAAGLSQCMRRRERFLKCPHEVESLQSLTWHEYYS